MDSALEDIKATIASCRTQIDKLYYFSDGKLCLEGVKLHQKCTDRIDADIAAYVVARNRAYAVDQQIYNAKCAHKNIE